MNVEVCHVSPSGATRIPVVIDDGAAVRDAVVASGIVVRCGLEGGDIAYAVFGRRADPATRLVDGDRVELLRPLIVDPKEARRRRDAKKRATPARGAGGDAGPVEPADR